MKIAYVVSYLNPTFMRGGVGEKITTQFRLWQNQGHDARLFMLAPAPIKLDRTDVYPFKPYQNLPVLKFPARELDRSHKLRQLIDGVRSFQPDIIYLRYCLYIHPLRDLYAIAPVIVELNTKDIEEYRLRGLIFYWFNRLTRGLLLSKAAGLIVPSHEIQQLPCNQIYRKPVRVIANGIDMDEYIPYPAPANYPPAIIFAGTPGNWWHGVDKLRELARRCPELQIEIYGYSARDIGDDIPENMRGHEFMNRDQFKPMLAHADVSCGTLALHRNNMREASPLKVREALAYGIPTILAYHDTDLADIRTDFLLHLPNTEDNVLNNINLIRDFVFRMIGKRADRELIYPRINQRQKEEARLAFFEEIIHTRAR